MLSSRLRPAPCSGRRPCRSSLMNIHGRQLPLLRCTPLRAAAAHDSSSTAGSPVSSSSSFGSGAIPIGRLPGHRVRRPLHRLAAIERQVDFELQRRATSRIPEVNELNAKYGFKSLVEFYEAENGLPACYLLHPRGHILEIYLQGATITRWIDELGKNLLFVRPDAVFEEGRAINSGIPLFFPQWREGLLPEMGFADKLKWEVVATDLDFEFFNRVGFPDFAGGKATMLVDEDYDSPFTMVKEPDNYAMEREAARDAAQARALAGALGGDTPKAAAASKKGRGRRKKAVEGADEAPAADSTDVSPAAALGELPKPTRPRRGRPSTKNPSPGPAGGPVVGAAAATPSADAGGSEGEAGEGEAGERPPQEVEAQGTSSDEEADLAAFEEWLEDVDWGMIGDLAPCVTLRLTDTSETREIWPHKFELLYKITLMENDDFPDPTAGLPDGVFPYTGSTANVPSFIPKTPDDVDTLPGPPRVNDMSTGDLAEPPMQIKLEWHLTNKGEAGEPPMEFQLGARTLFATKDQSSYRNMVQVLGLGGKMMLDYEPDTRAPHLNLCEEDYLDFDGARHDAVYINTQDATVKFCPGGRTHFELLQREGLNDTIAYHPGGLPPPGMEEASRFMAGVGVGRIAVPKRLKPGDSWRGEYAIRHHRRYWEPPLWARRQVQPMPGLVLEDDEADGEDAVDAELMQDMERQQIGGLVADGPQ